MEALIRGRLEVRETVGSEVVINEDGIGSATIAYHAPRTEAVSAAISMIAHPDYSWLKRKSIKVTMEEGNMAKISATFEGVPPQGLGGGTPTSGSTIPKYSMKTSTNSEPIETHPNFTAMAGTFASREQAPFKGHVRWVTEGDEQGKFVGFIGYQSDNANIRSLAGVKNYLTPGIIFQETRLYERTGSGISGSTQVSLVSVGCIDTPPDIGKFAQIPPNYNWLLIGCDAEQVGYGYKVVKQWKLSGPNGWNPLVYTRVNRS